MAVKLQHDDIILRQWQGLTGYEAAWEAMREFTRNREETAQDELWLLEHHPVYTLGIRAKDKPSPAEISGIPVVQTDRGGLITYHGPGQAVIYVLVDLRRRGIGLKHLVDLLEQSVIDLLADAHIAAQRRDGAPGVYVDDRKLASLGLRMISGRTYHGISVNVDMDLAPFEQIDPCGMEGLQMTDFARLGCPGDTPAIGRRLAREIARLLGYTHLTDSQPDPLIKI